MAIISRKSPSSGSVQEFQVPAEVGRPVRGRGQQDERAEAHHRSRGASQRRRPFDRAQIARAEQVRCHHAGARADPGHGIFTTGPACVWNFGAGLGSEVSLANFRKDIYLEFYNEAGQLVIAYKIFRCWVSEYQAMPDLDANANAIAIEHIKLENEGWERDTSVTEPQEPTLSIVAT